MTPVVNHKYKYILLYSAKAGCTSSRLLYLDVHKDELNAKQLSRLKKYHNLNEVQPYDPDRKPRGYFTYLITRNPYSRVVSAFLDQYVYLRNAGVTAMLERCPPANAEPKTFIQFLEYLKSVPEDQRDSHFQSQAYFPLAKKVVTPASFFYRVFKLRHRHSFGIDYVGDISDFEAHSKTVFARIFRRDKAKLSFALKQLNVLKKRNTSFYDNKDYADAANLTVDQLDEMLFSPKPQDFYTSEKARELVQEIYEQDFNLFNYSKENIPQKKPSSEINLVPKDFDWQMYLDLSPDLPRDEIYNERSVLRHYLEFGRFESHLRAYKVKAPKDFHWQRYLSLHDDLPASGIITEEAAIKHYISYGIREGRAT